ncbi:MAG: DUF4288 domain-containing protein [Deltaproteobacteria bacterium]
MYFSVSLLYEAVRENNDAPLWEERIILINAIDEVEAEGKAKQYAHKEEISYETGNGSRVKWVFRQVERIYMIDDELGDGAEVFSRFLRDSEVKSMLTPFDE